ncbi:pcmt1 protein [Salpingoeca rosetta]|uniref:protein-L-isoaspartate(D-aspartate) O-methyltransferase n=1 Tax=Salpingoeca rosetta (strain ATCC 50818 / BSB-021) TaxID=946362 RepID=F2U9K1_SALR5|nr:pcmt1 protein [Salpingoeca rosetta]EGD73028.1 pcmt1 protein [Salpingoeca rosetta]|eukprot:XP_004994059.1 pcmt1 protein [Salpingoeca rosetta]
MYRGYTRCLAITVLALLLIPLVPTPCTRATVHRDTQQREQHHHQQQEQHRSPPPRHQQHHHQHLPHTDLYTPSKPTAPMDDPVVALPPSDEAEETLSQAFRRVADMAWRCSAKSNSQLVSNLRNGGIIKHDDVEAALRATDRGLYVPKDQSPYEDAPQYIGYNSTISAPHMHAYALECLHDRLKPGARVLDIGCGSGVLVEAFSRMVGPEGVVVGVEHIPELAEMSKRNLKKCPEMAKRMDAGHVHVFAGDGFKGHPELGPYDAIHVGAAAAKMPQHLVDQLNVGGAMVLPLGPEHGYQEFVKVYKNDDGELEKRHLLDVRYVPLTTPEHQLRGFH